MTLGIRMRQKNGVKVIDDRFSNLALTYKGIYVSDGSERDIPGIPRTKYVEVSGTNPVIAISNSFLGDYGGGARARRVDMGNGIFRFFFCIPMDYWAPISGIQINYYIFDITPISGVSGIGFRIRNRLTNGVVFDSRYRYMKVVGFQTLTGTFPYPGPVIRSFAYTATSVAVIQSQTPMKFFDYGSGMGGGTECFTMRTRVSGNSVTVVEGREWQRDGNLVTVPPDYYTFDMLVIETSGL